MITARSKRKKNLTPLKWLALSVFICWGLNIFGENYEIKAVKPKFISPLSDAIIIERPVEVEKIVEVEKPVPVPLDCKTEKCRILAYLVEKFGDDADNAITMIRTCENSTFNPKRMSDLNVQQSGRRSYDVGVMQINVDEGNTEEIEKLKDYKYNIDRGYQKYLANDKTFFAWSCAHVIGQKNFAGK